MKLLRSGFQFYFGALDEFSFEFESDYLKMYFGQHDDNCTWTASEGAFGCDTRDFTSELHSIVGSPVYKLPSTTYL